MSDDELDEKQEITDNKSSVLMSGFDPLKTLQEEVDALRQELANTKDEIKDSRFDLIALLSVFVGLITYLGLEIQVFKTINNPLLIIGVSIFFIASILLFILTINQVMKKVKGFKWSDFVLYIILFILLCISVAFIIYGYRDFSLSNLTYLNLILYGRY